MRQMDAMRVQLALADALGAGQLLIVGRQITITVPEGCDFLHLMGMPDDLEARAEPASDAKTGRWLGWVSGVLSLAGILSLEECKRINMEHSDDAG